MKLLPYVLFEEYTNILALEMDSPGNRHCANCIGTLSFPIPIPRLFHRPYMLKLTHQPRVGLRLGLAAREPIHSIYLFIYLFVQIAVGRFKNDQIAAITQLYLKETAENFTRKVGAIFGQFQRKVKSILRYDAIQDDISTCNQKLTCVSLIYSTEPATNSGEKK